MIQPQAPSEKTTPPAPGESPHGSGLTLRALLAGTVGVVAVSFLVTWAEIVLSTIRIGYLQFPPAAFGLLLFVVAISQSLRRVLGGRLTFAPSELTTVYVMLLMGAMVSSHGLAQRLLPLLVMLNYRADADNNWRGLFFGHVPRWLVPWDPNGLEKQPVALNYFNGLPRGGAVPWGAWAVPLLCWGALMACVFFAFYCLVALLRRQWVENERLAFPLAQLPLELIGGEGQGRPFLADPRVWLGAAVPIWVYGLNWLHQIYPFVPGITIQGMLDPFLPGPPWNVLQGTPVALSFAALGFFFLLPADILFSLWFFFLATQIARVAGVYYGSPLIAMPIENVTYVQGYMSIGANFVLAGSFFWMARVHLGRVWQAVRRGGSREAIWAEEANEMLPYRTAFWGLLLSLTGACLFMTAMGMSPWLAALEIVVAVLVIGLVMARTTAEAGVLMTETTFHPADLVRIFGSLHGLGAANLTGLGFMDHVLIHDQRSMLTTAMFDASWLSGKSGLRLRSLGGAVALGIGVAAVVAVPLQLWLAYTRGGNKLDFWMIGFSSSMQFNRFANEAQGTSGPLPSGLASAGLLVAGVLFTLFLMLMRRTFFWWPLHPLGFVIAGTFTTIMYWFPCLLAWAFKSLVLRYGGMGLYRRVRPFFLGLICGEVLMAILSTLANVLFKVQPPAFPY